MSDALAPRIHCTGHDDSCPVCNAVINAHMTPAADARPPREGDVGICGVCLSVLIYTPAGVRAPTGPEERAIMDHPEAGASIRAFRATAMQARRLQ